MAMAEIEVGARSATGSAPRLSSQQIWAICLCGLVAIIDGFDVQAIAFVAPAIARQWKIDPSSFGPIFGAGLLGLVIGSLMFGAAADRWGRKPLIIISTLVFSVFAGSTAFSQSPQHLIIFRFLTGLGLGGAMPNIVALITEYAPAHRRATFVTMILAAFPLGGMLGGMASIPILTAYGWRAVFLLGCLPPLALALLLFWRLPESVRFLATKAKTAEDLSQIARRLGFGSATDLQSVLGDEGHSHTTSRILDLFREGRALGTLLIWTVFFFNLLSLFFLINWIPSVLQKAGLPIEQAIVGSVALNVGGILGSLILGRCVDRFGGIRILTVTYVCAAVFVFAVGIVVQLTIVPVLITILLAGFFVSGGQFCMTALAAAYYSTSLRSTGVGWGLGVGRIGSICGPVLGGAILTLGITLPQLFIVAAVPMLIALCAVAAFGRFAR
jgi:AAHS family 4-hydroxybenzoate transporter-like MFS transporter